MRPVQKSSWPPMTWDRPADWPTKLYSLTRVVCWNTLQPSNSLSVRTPGKAALSSPETCFGNPVCLPACCSGASRTACRRPRNPLTLASTTSTENSGLLGEILPRFTKDTGIAVRVVAVGTGAALNLGRSGDADILLVHAREDEDAFVAAGYGALPTRRDVQRLRHCGATTGPCRDRCPKRTRPARSPQSRCEKACSSHARTTAAPHKAENANLAFSGSRSGVRFRDAGTRNPVRAWARP